MQDNAVTGKKVEDKTMRTTVGEFIIRRLKELGIEHIIGVPGDFNLSFIEQINEAENIEFVGACNELNAAYAADGYGRQSGVGALLTTYGVGELSALNGIAGARAEHVPMVSLAGSPPLYSTEYRWNLHHSLADGDFENMLDSILPFTGAAVRITPMNVVEELDRALHICLREKRPVHIQIPSDITHLEIEAPEEALDTTLPASDAERLEAATTRVLERIAEAKKPVFLFDQDTDRHGFTEKFRTLVDKLQIPYSQLTSGKGVLSERDGLFLGSYNGKASAPGVQKIVESADLLFTTNPRFIEVNSGSFTHHLPAEAIVNFGDQHVNVGGEFFVGINTLELLDALIDRTKASRKKKKEEFVYDEWEIDAEAPLTHARMWPRFIRFLEDDDTVIAEAGTSHIGLTPERLPKGARYINSPIWGAIGFTLPALLGSMLANRDRRHVLFIGDGSFQLTAQELSTILREDLKPIIVLVNNKGYTIERYILGMEEKYNDIADWQYAKLPQVFVPDTTMVSYQARTEGELEDALSKIQASDAGAFLEVHLDAMDAPAGLKAFGPMTADFDFGPRGPRNP